MKGYRFDVVCPHCGTDGFDEVNRAPRTAFDQSAVTETFGIVVCRCCDREWVVSVQLRPLSNCVDKSSRDRKRRQRARQEVGA